MINKRRLALVLAASMLLIQSEVEYSSLKESKVELLTLYKGKTEDLRIVKKGKKTGKGYLYQGFNKKVISVSKTGKVTAKKAGTTTIVLKKKSNGKKTKIKIKVVDYVKELRISSATNLVMKQGMKKSIRATVYPKTAKNRQVSYKSSNRNIALVYSDGTVKAMESGVAVITVSTKGINKKGKKIVKKIYVGVLGDTSPVPTPNIPDKDDDVIGVYTPIPSSVPTVTATVVPTATATSNVTTMPTVTPTATAGTTVQPTMMPPGNEEPVPTATATSEPTNKPSGGGNSGDQDNSDAQGNLQEIINQIPVPDSSTLLASMLVAKSSKGVSTLYFINRNYQGNMHVSVDGLDMSSEQSVSYVLKRMATEVTGSGTSVSINPGDKMENKYYDEEWGMWRDALMVTRGTLKDAWLITNRKNGNEYRLSAWEKDEIYGTPYGLIITDGDTTSKIKVY